MFNVGGGELLVILLIALIVLGPQKLPEAAKQIGGFARELRRMSNSFQNELKHALDEPIENEARDRGRKVVSSEQKAAPSGDASADEQAGAGEIDSHEIDTEVDDPPSETVDDDESATAGPEADELGADTEVEPSRPMSTAEAAGMYDLMPTEGSSEPSATTQADSDQDRAETTDEPGS